MKPLVVEDIHLHWVRLVPGRPPAGLGLFIPVDPNAVLEDFDDEEFVQTDGRLPYFASLWPSAVALCQDVMDGPSLEGLRILDLGCGVGAVGIAAARRGARVSFLDWEPRALEIVRRSLEALRLPHEACIAADWREPPAMGRFDRVLAADVLYEERNIPGVVRFLHSVLAPDGEAWIADPNRRHAEDFPPAAREAGLVVDPPRHLGVVQDTAIQVHRLRLPRGSGPASGEPS